MPSLLSVTVDASNTSNFQLDENYRVQITYTYGGVQYTQTLYFDCVLEPFLNQVGLSDLVSEVADMEERLTRQATKSDTANVRAKYPLRFEARRGYATNYIFFRPEHPNEGWVTVTGTPTYTLHKPDGTQLASGNCTVTAESGTASRTALTMASVYATLAWAQTKALIEAHCEAKQWTRPRLIIDQEKIRQVIVAFAISRAYRAEGGAADSESRLLAEDWKQEAESRFAALGPLRYDDSEDRVADETLGGWSVRSLERSW